MVFATTKPPGGNLLTCIRVKILCYTDLSNKLHDKTNMIMEHYAGYELRVYASHVIYSGAMQHSLKILNIVHACNILQNERGFIRSYCK